MLNQMPTKPRCLHHNEIILDILVVLEKCRVKQSSITKHQKVKCSRRKFVHCSSIVFFERSLEILRYRGKYNFKNNRSHELPTTIKIMFCCEHRLPLQGISQNKRQKNRGERSAPVETRVRLLSPEHWGCRNHTKLSKKLAARDCLFEI